MCDVDDGEATHGQRNRVFFVVASVIWSPMHDGIVHRADQPMSAFCSRLDCADDAAHAMWPWIVSDEASLTVEVNPMAAAYRTAPAMSGDP